MSLTRKEIHHEAMKLDPADREALAEDLLLSLSEENRAAIDQAWLEEVHQRDAQYQNGAMSARPVQEVISRLKRKARR